MLIYYDRCGDNLVVLKSMDNREVYKDQGI